RAGVTHPTVSRALRDDPQIKKATREKIQQLAREMGYRPDPALTALAAYRSTIQPTHRFEKLAILVPEREGELPANIREQVRGICERAEELGFTPELFPIARTQKEQLRTSRAIYNRGIRGVVVTAIRWPLEGF